MTENVPPKNQKNRELKAATDRKHSSNMAALVSLGEAFTIQVSQTESKNKLCAIFGMAYNFLTFNPLGKKKSNLLPGEKENRGDSTELNFNFNSTLSRIALEHQAEELYRNGEEKLANVRPQLSILNKFPDSSEKHQNNTTEASIFKESTLSYENDPERKEPLYNTAFAGVLTSKELDKQLSSMEPLSNNTNEKRFEDRFLESQAKALGTKHEGRY